MIAPLPYTLHTRYASIATAWTIITIPPILINLGLFYGLWYGAPTLDRITVLTLPTAVLGIFTAVAVIERVWKLARPAPTFRPLGSPRAALDIFQWGYFAAILVISALISSTLARGDGDHDGHALQIRLLSLPAPVLMYFLAVALAMSVALHLARVKLPFHFGSFEANSVVLPAVYYVVEDIVAVDGNGGIEYREAFYLRYKTSPLFCRMILVLSVAWMVFFAATAASFTVIIFWIPANVVTVAYGVGWAGPFPIAGAMAFGTILYVRKCLREELTLDLADNDNRIRSPSEDEQRPLLRAI